MRYKILMSLIDANPKKDSANKAHPWKVVSSLVKTRRYALSDLLEGLTQISIKKLNLETCWARQGIALGRELL
ncbi:MAG: hypothetical protein WCK49_03570 [Myxococcaceae bacterium]